MTDVAVRCGAEVVRIDVEWGEIIDPDRIVKTLKKHTDAGVFAIVHAETQQELDSRSKR